MLPLRPAARNCSLQAHTSVVSVSTVWHRHVSLTGAISGGVRKAAAALKSAEKRRVREGQLGFWEEKDPEKRAQAQQNVRRQRDYELERRRDLQWLSSDDTLPTEPELKQDRKGDPRRTPRRPNDQTHAQRGLGREDPRDAGNTSWRMGRSNEEQMRDTRPEMRFAKTPKHPNAIALARGMLVDAPQAMPYSEAASEFLYGTFAVLAALQAKRRKLYKLYIWCGEDGTLSDNDDKTTEIVRQAKAAKVPIVRVAGNWDKLLDRMSDKRPHNGLVLEAAAIPKLSAKYLERIESVKSPLLVKLNNMSRSEKEDLGLPVTADSIELSSDQRKAKRFPFLLWLDKVTDTGNMGAIFRSAYFLGVDAVILPRHGTAPLTAVTIKNSAGAAEHVPILTIEHELNFMKASQEKGWLFVASGSASSESTVSRSIKEATGEEQPSQALKYHPVVLMMGNEGEGLRPFLQQQANYITSIASARSDGLIDSLNVSVAAALLTQKFLASFTTAALSGT